MKSQKLLILITFLILTFPSQTFAAIPDAAVITGADPVAQRFSGNLGNLISNALGIVFSIAGILAFVWAFVGVFQYITAGGNKEGLEKAKKRIYWAVIGLVFLMLAFTFSSLVRELFQINPTNAPPIRPTG